MFILIHIEDNKPEYIDVYESLVAVYQDFRRILKNILRAEGKNRDEIFSIIKQAWIKKEYKTLYIIYRPSARNKDRKIYYNSKYYTITQFNKEILKDRDLVKKAQNHRKTAWEYLICTGVIDEYGKCRF